MAPRASPAAILPVRKPYSAALRSLEGAKRPTLQRVSARAMPERYSRCWARDDPGTGAATAAPPPSLASAHQMSEGCGAMAGGSPRGCGRATAASRRRCSRAGPPRRVRPERQESADATKAHCRAWPNPGQIGAAHGQTWLPMAKSAGDDVAPLGLPTAAHRRSD